MPFWILRLVQTHGQTEITQEETWHPAWPPAWVPRARKEAKAAQPGHQEATAQRRDPGGQVDQGEHERQTRDWNGCQIIWKEGVETLSSNQPIVAAGFETAIEPVAVSQLEEPYLKPTEKQGAD
jgi:hypothetical protein